MPAAPASLPLDHVDAWIFDLDNTLYPPEADIFAQIDERMGRFIADLLDCDRVEARRIQKDYFHTPGTTRSGLMAPHHNAPERQTVGWGTGVSGHVELRGRGFFNKQKTQ